MALTYHENRDGFFAVDEDGNSTDYYPTRAALKFDLARDEAIFTGGGFELVNDPPAHTPQQFHGLERTKQAALITGTKLLRGQLDLF